MRRIWSGIACGLIAFGLIELRQSPATAQNTSPSIVWLVRHADRADDSPDSPLKKPEGEKRAQDLKTCLSGKGVTAIITTQKERTVKTADPLASELKKQKSDFAPKEVMLDESKLKQHIEAVAAEVRGTSGNVLVVGHSNTVARIIEKLRGPAGIGNLTVFHRLFELKFSNGNVAFNEMTYGVAPKSSKKKQC